MENALAQDGSALLSQSEQARIRASVAGLRSKLETVDHHAIKRAITNLNEATMTFAQARMDKSVSSALGGRKLTDLEGV